MICLPLVIKGIDNIRSKKPEYSILLRSHTQSYPILHRIYGMPVFCGILCRRCHRGENVTGTVVGKIWRFLLYSLIAGAISAVYTVPTYYAIRNTAASSAGFGGK